MYVSVTGLQTKGIASWLRFWALAIPSFRAAKKAKGARFVDTKTRQGTHHTLTVWDTEADMKAYRKSPVHLISMRAFAKIATGKVHGYEAEQIPTWDEALAEYDAHGRVV